MAIYAWRNWRPSHEFDISLAISTIFTLEHNLHSNETYSSIKLIGAAGVQWPVGRSLEARCMYGSKYINSYHADGDTPGVGCTCGIYALKKPSNYFREENITGIVEIWGKIITARRGYRAQFGQIRAVVNAPKLVSETYGIPNLPSIRSAKREYFR